MKKVNLIFAIFIFMAVCVGVSSCKDKGEELGEELGEGGSGLYLGIIGFNDKLYPYDYNSNSFRLLNSNAKESFENHISKLELGIGTSLFYAVDNAIDKLENGSFPYDLTKVAIVTFTDGLDLGSIEYGDKYSDVSTVSERLKSANISGINIDAYAIGVIGDDVNTYEDRRRFRENLIALSSSESNAMEVNSMYEVQNKFKEIANSLYSETTSSSISIVCPGLADGKKVRFTFDGNLSYATSSRCYLEGTWNRENKILSSVTFEGLNTSNGSSVSLKKEESIFYSFVLDDVMRIDEKELNKENIQMWISDDGSSWQINSEFDPEQSDESIVEQKSAMIMLVLDCSKSLESSGLAQMKSAAQGFISTLYNNLQNNDNDY